MRDEPCRSRCECWLLCGARCGRVEGIDKITLVAVMRIEGKGTSEKDQYQLGGFCNDPGDIDVLSKAVTLIT